MSAHTPGNWYALYGAVISDKLNDYGNFVITACQRELTDQDKANLRLIAAAPELLALVRAYSTTYPLDEYADRAAEIIAKAQGGDHV